MQSSSYYPFCAVHVFVGHFIGFPLIEVLALFLVELHHVRRRARFAVTNGKQLQIPLGDSRTFRRSGYILFAANVLPNEVKLAVRTFLLLELPPRRQARHYATW